MCKEAQCLYFVQRTQAGELSPWVLSTLKFCIRKISGQSSIASAALKTQMWLCFVAFASLGGREEGEWETLWAFLPLLQSVWSRLKSKMDSLRHLILQKRPCCVQDCLQAGVGFKSVVGRRFGISVICSWVVPFL